MNGAFGSLGMNLVLVAAAGVLLFGVLFGARWALSVLPMNKERRAVLERASPLVGALVVLSYLLLAARSLFHDEPIALPVVLALVVAGFAFAAWPAARDVLAGVSLKAGRVCHVGDHIRCGDLEGRVLSMGYRVLTMETTNGDQAIVPYSIVARDALVRTRSLGGVTAHRFELEIATPGAFSELRARVVEAALLSHWCAFTREPEVRPLRDGCVEVTVFALDASHGPDIEAAVRTGLSNDD